MDKEMIDRSIDRQTNISSALMAPSSLLPLSQTEKKPLPLFYKDQK